ncbi:hypothetical protein NEUTE2DRAFT_75911 [Neurospora tetrasperma FGSC 2509]|nr:hypothetical protein NEUTE2DRAFT_75911 [Neurospora tetrasperma FGSC 2509]
MEMFEVQQKPAFLPLDYHLDARHCSAVLCKKLRYHSKGNSPLFEIQKQTVPNSHQSGVAENGNKPGSSTNCLLHLALQKLQSTDVDSSVPGRFNYLF